MRNPHLHQHCRCPMVISRCLGCRSHRPRRRPKEGRPPCCLMR